MKFQKILRAEYPPGPYDGYERISITLFLKCGCTKEMFRTIGVPNFRYGDKSFRWLVESPPGKVKCPNGCG